MLKDLIDKAYTAFNKRDINTAFSTMHRSVKWPKAFEGGYAHGHREIRQYWTKQWMEINPNVDPVDVSERAEGTIEVLVHQTVRDMDGRWYLMAW